MLGISSIGSASGTADYFAKDNYYSQEQSIHSSEWHGKGAEALGLSGTVDDKKLLEVLEGKFGNVQFGKAGHNPGRDFTFSMPKSASIVALVGGDKRVTDAYMAAIKETMNYVEKYLIVTRQRDGKGTGKINISTGNIIMAMFPHDTSRAKDANGHIHVLTANGTIDKDGNYKAVNFHPIYSVRYELNQMASELFRNSLHKMGYQTADKDKGGHFEIVGVPQHVNDQFSKRSKQIKSLLQNIANPSWAQKQTAAYVDRPHKGNIRSKDLVEGWRAEAKALGFDAERFAMSIQAPPEKSLVSQIKNSLAQIFSDRHPSHEKPSGKFATLTDVTQYAISALSDEKTTFKRTQIIAEVLAITQGSYGVEQINKNIDKQQKDIDLVPFKERTYAGNVFTTKSLIAAEKNIINMVESGKNTGSLYQDVYAARHAMHRTKLDNNISTHEVQGQMAAAEQILFGKDYISGVQGYAGTGKTTLLEKVVEVSKTLNEAQRENHQIIGMAPTDPATAELKKSLGTAGTFQKFMHSTLNIRNGGAPLPEQLAKFQGKTVVLDEASMISVKEMVGFLETSKKLGVAKIVTIGDTDQIQSLKAGAAFKLMQESGMKVTVLTEIFRQRHFAVLKSAINRAIEFNSRGQHKIAESFKELSPYISTHKDPNRSAARAYVDKVHQLSVNSTLTEKERATVIVTPSNKNVTEISSHVREMLKAKNLIGAQDTQIITIQSLHLSHIQKAATKNYNVGDVLIFNRDLHDGKIKGQKNYTVTKLDSAKNTIFIQEEGAKGPQRYRLTNKGGYYPFDVVKSATKGFAAGDLVKFTFADKQQNIARNQTGKILDISDGAITINVQGKDKDQEAQKVVVATNSMAAKGLTHNYASTIFSTQGKSIANVIVAMGGKAFSTTYENFYVAISRATTWIQIHTDNKQDLEQTIQMSSNAQTEHAIDHQADKGSEILNDQTQKDPENREEKVAGKAESEAEKTDTSAENDKGAVDEQKAETKSGEQDATRYNERSADEKAKALNNPINTSSIGDEHKAAAPKFTMPTTEHSPPPERTRVGRSR